MLEKSLRPGVALLPPPPKPRGPPETLRLVHELVAGAIQAVLAEHGELPAEPEPVPNMDAEARPEAETAEKGPAKLDMEAGASATGGVSEQQEALDAVPAATDEPAPPSEASPVSTDSPDGSAGGAAAAAAAPEIIMSGEVGRAEVPSAAEPQTLAPEASAAAQEVVAQVVLAKMAAASVHDAAADGKGALPMPEACSLDVEMGSTQQDGILAPLPSIHAPGERTLTLTEND